MGLRINTDMAALNQLRGTRKSESSQPVRTADQRPSETRDTAALQAGGDINARNLRVMLTRMARGIENSQAALNMTETAGGALDEIQSLVQGVRDAAREALDNPDADTAALQEDVDVMINAVRRIAETTRFENTSLFDGAAGIKVDIQSDLIENVDVAMARFRGHESLTFEISLDTADDGSLRVSVNNDEARPAGDDYVVRGENLISRFTLSENVEPGSELSFEVSGGAMAYEINYDDSGADTVTMGLPNPSGGSGLSYMLSELETLSSGGENDLFNNPGAALETAENVVEQTGYMSDLMEMVRSFIVNPNIEALETGLENVTSSLGELDANLAREISQELEGELSENARVSILGQAAINQSNALNLLGELGL